MYHGEGYVHERRRDGAEREDPPSRGPFRAGRTEWAGVSTRKGGGVRGRHRRGRDVVAVFS